jgi:uncharacterized caspase-like protein
MKRLMRHPVSIVSGLLLALCMLLPANAAEDKRVAIVMGNGTYLYTDSLPNPPNDAKSISSALRVLGFEVHTVLDASKQDLRELQGSLHGILSHADVGLFFYAGHGLQINGENFIVPVDASFEHVQDLSGELASMSNFLASMEEYSETNLIFLDACRNNPLAEVIQSLVAAGRSISIDEDSQVRSVGQGLAEMHASVGTLIAYATQPGNVAEDGKGVNSPFTTGILRHIHEPGLEIREILTSVRVSVLAETERRQIPWDHSSLTEDFYFIAPVKPRDVPIPPP